MFADVHQAFQMRHQTPVWAAQMLSHTALHASANLQATSVRPVELVLWDISLFQMMAPGEVLYSVVSVFPDVLDVQVLPHALHVELG